MVDTKYNTVMSVSTKPDLILTTDASLLGWGAVSNEKETGGHWHLEEKISI